MKDSSENTSGSTYADAGAPLPATLCMHSAAYSAKMYARCVRKVGITVTARVIS